MIIREREGILALLGSIVVDFIYFPKHKALTFGNLWKKLQRVRPGR